MYAMYIFLFQHVLCDDQPVYGVCENKIEGLAQPNLNVVEEGT
jgi:hypothetical protein